MSDDSGLNRQTAAAAAALVALFTAAEVYLLGQFAKLITKYVSGALLQLVLRKVTGRVVSGLRARTGPLVERLISEASTAGSDAGRVEAERALSSVSRAADSFAAKLASPGEVLTHQQASAQAIADDLKSKLESLNSRIVRFSDDVYRAVTSPTAIEQVLGGGLTPEQASTQAYRELRRKGITGFTDSRGRTWTLSAYVEMAVRTSVQRTYNASHLARMQAAGIDLFTVTDDGHPCPLCQPWQNKVLSVLPDDRAVATIAEATAAGLFHPRCRHSLVAFLPGVTVLPEPHEWTDADQERYDNTQRQRAIERRIRAAKRDLAGAVTPDDKARARHDVAAAQATMREFIKATGLVRRSNREQLKV